MTAVCRAGRAAHRAAWPARAAVAILAWVAGATAPAGAEQAPPGSAQAPINATPAARSNILRPESVARPSATGQSATLDKPPHPLLAQIAPQLEFGFRHLRPDTVQRASQLPPSSDPRSFSGRYSPAEAILLLPGERGRMASYTDRGARTFLAHAQEVLAGKPRPDPLTSCKPGGPVRALNRGFTVQILQSAGELTIVHMEDHQVRHIRIGGSQVAQPLPTLSGTSRGHWEGNTLVVETRAFRDGGWLDDYGNPASDRLMLLERFIKQPNGSLRIEVTVNDPVNYSEPVRMVRNWTWTPNVSWSEMICEDGHRGAPTGGTR